MQKIFDLVNSGRLTLTQWLLITLSTVIGGLVIALKMKGSALHKSQVQLLQQRYLNENEKNDAKVDAARKDFMEAYHEYQKHS